MAHVAIADRQERGRGAFERRKWGDAFADLSAAQLDTYAGSRFVDTRRKAQKFGARGTALKVYKAAARGER